MEASIRNVSVNQVIAEKQAAADAAAQLQGEGSMDLVTCTDGSGTEKSVNGKSSMTYFGYGEEARQAAAEDEAHRAERRRQKAERVEYDRRLDQAADPLIALDDLAERMSRAALYGDGYYLSDRHWKKRRRANGKPQ